MNQVIISASILSADFLCLADTIKHLENEGVQMIHLDVMDGHFVPNITIGPKVVESIRNFTSLPLDVHLMIADPAAYLEDFARAGADYISIHPEVDPHIHRSLNRIRELGCKSAIAFNPSTSIEGLPFLLDCLDMVLLMTVNPGFGGQKFIGTMENKIFQVRKMLDRYKETKIRLEVDGGIKDNNCARVVEKGADTLVIGSYLTKKGKIGARVKKIKSIIG